MQANEKINALIYDCEIIKAIPDHYGDDDESIDYCDGWTDFENMGISVIGVYDIYRGMTRVFLQDNFNAFQALVKQRDLIIGFNSISFDDLLCEANNISVRTDYDLLGQVRIATGQPPFYTKGLTRGGYSLEALAQVNLGYGKSGNGALAPVLWQRGNFGKVIDYCLLDVQITYELFKRRLTLKDPTNGFMLKLSDPLAGLPLD